MARFRWIIRVVALFSLITLVASQLTTDPDPNFATPATCTANSDCVTADVKAVCLAPTGSTALRCTCDTAGGFLKINNKCVVPSGLGQACSLISSICTDANSACVPSGQISSVNHCKCKPGYIAVKDETLTPPKIVCYMIRTEQDDPGCKTCEDNDGTCFVDATSALRCKCPVSRTGNDCEVIHVNATCDATEFEMLVCYEPHPKVDFSAGSAMYAEGKGTDVACQGKPDTTSLCANGAYYLKLPLEAQTRARCGTQEFKKSTTTRTFQNKIVVTVPNDEEKVFVVYCTFVTTTNKNSGGVGVIVKNGNDRGEFLKPTIDFIVMNVWHNPLPQSAALTLQDYIILQAELTDDGTYMAIAIDHCIASSSPVVNDPKSVTVLLIEKGCPATGQDIITDANNFKQKAGDIATLRTGDVKMFMLAKGHTIFIHCTIKLCLKGDEANCQPQSCGSQAAPLTLKRKKRETYSAAEVTQAIHWYDPDEEQAGQKSANTIQMNTAGFVGLVGFMAVLVVIFLVLSVALFIRQRAKPYQIDDHIPEKPQRFALPRIARNNMRL